MSGAVVKKKRRIRRIAIVIIVAAFLIYTIHGSVMLGDMIEAKEKEAENLRVQIEEQMLINEELERQLAQPIDAEYIERVAHEQLGLAYPNERVFINVDAN